MLSTENLVKTLREEAARSVAEAKRSIDADENCSPDAGAHALDRATLLRTAADMIVTLSASESQGRHASALPAELRGALTQGWRPVTETEPARETMVLVTCAGSVHLAYRDGVGWMFSQANLGWYRPTKPVTAWQPLPAPAASAPPAQKGDTDGHPDRRGEADHSSAGATSGTLAAGSVVVQRQRDAASDARLRQGIGDGRGTEGGQHLEHAQDQERRGGLVAAAPPLHRPRQSQRPRWRPSPHRQAACC